MIDDPHFPAPRLKRLHFRASHRGFREADLIFGLFAEAFGAHLSPEELDQFEALLEEPDPLSYAWVIGREPTPAAFETPLMARLRAFVPEAHRRLRSSS
jgi:antitoxin CptB